MSRSRVQAGRVKWWRKSDGTGYITSCGVSYYVDRSSLLECTDLQDGELVVFTPEQIMDRWCAAGVTVVRVG